MKRRNKQREGRAKFMNIPTATVLANKLPLKKFLSRRSEISLSPTHQLADLLDGGLSVGELGAQVLGDGGDQEAGQRVRWLAQDVADESVRDVAADRKSL